MKNTLIFSICCLTIICFCGISPTAYLRAQQAVVVTPEVKADTIRRLEFAKTWEMPKQSGFVSTKNAVGEKTYRNICNGKPDKHFQATQVDACSSYMNDIPVVHSIDDVMPGFKACALDETRSVGCSGLLDGLVSLGLFNYALALIQSGHTLVGVSISIGAPKDSYALVRFFTRPGASSLFFTTPGQLGGRVMQVDDGPDIVAILRSFCLYGQSPDACSLAASIGAAVPQAEIAQAQNQLLIARDDLEQARRDGESRVERNDAAQDATLNAISGAVSAVAASTPTIQETAAQNQANLQAMDVAAQQRQQAQEQARLAAEQSARATQATTTSARSALSNTNASSSPATVVSPSTPNPTNNPYSSTSAQGSYNPYTGTGSGSVQGRCTDMTASVQGTAKIGSDGWVSGYLTNNSNQALFVSYTFKQNGVPSNAMANAGGTTIQGGQTVGGEGQGLYSTGADKNPPEIYWYAVLKSEHDQYGCVHKW
jgi:hypothetical protein